MDQTALVIIDAQTSFRHRPYWSEAESPTFLSATQRLIDRVATAGLPILQVFHIEDEGPFSMASGFVETLAPLAIRPNAIFHKRRHSALVGTGLDVWLVKNGIRRLIVAGIRTEQCCETTTRHASDLGFAVDYVTEATLTFPMQDAAGRLWSAAEIKARTELVLAGRFARIRTVDEVLGELPLARAA